MALRTTADVTVLVNSENSSTAERRVTPSWTISQLKTKLLPVTGIPPPAQQLTLRLPHAPQPISIASEDEENTQIAAFPLQPYCEIHVVDTRPPSMRLNLTDTSEVEKFELPPEVYAKRSDSVLAWKRRNQLGRFDPNKSGSEQLAAERWWEEIRSRGIEVGKRCRVGGEGGRLGTVRFVGEVTEIPNGGLWVGVEGDEPTGKNDGSVQGVYYFRCEPKFGSFVRPERLEIGGFQRVDEFENLEEM